MLYSSNRIFIHIPKTGGSSIRKYLKSIGWKSPELPMGYNAWWHRPYFMTPKSIVDNKIAVTLVRNPWDFYVSYCAYEKTLEPIFSLSRDDSFEDFLIKLLNGKSKDVFHLPQKIQFPIAQFLCEKEIGLQTFYYIYMTIDKDPRKFILSDNELNILNYKTTVRSCKLEDLEREFSKIFALDLKHQQKFVNSKRQNQSRRSKDYRVYYTPELRQLVAEREKYIIETFNYSF